MPMIFIYTSNFTIESSPGHMSCSVGVVAITSALHAEGRGFDPLTEHILLQLFDAIQ